MAYMKRFIIAGSRSFNNYFIVYRYLQRFLPHNAIICNGGSNGADQLAKVYAECNGHVYEDYPAQWNRFGKKASTIRNMEMVKLSDHAILFWDGKSPNTGELIECLKKRRIDPIIIDITDEDIVKPHPGIVMNATRDPFDIWIGRGRGGVWGNPYAISDTRDREYVIAMYTDFLLKQDVGLLRSLVDLKGKTLGCNCAPNLCHGDMLVWLIDHALPEIKEICDEKAQKNQSQSNDAKRPIDLWQVLSQKYDKNGSRDILITPTGLAVSNGYNTIVQDGRNFYIEISDKDICKQNLWLSMDERTRVVDEEPPKVIYHTVDDSKLAVFFQQTGFADSPFKTGRWYVDATKVNKKI